MANNLKTWLAEFYPKEAIKASSTDIAATKHSLQKWTGFLSKNLKKHNLKKDPISKGIRDSSGNEFYASSSTCAMCMRSKIGCFECPFYTLYSSYHTCEAEYREWYIKGDPKPMIKELKKILAMLESKW